MKIILLKHIYVLIDNQTIPIPLDVIQHIFRIHLKCLMCGSDILTLFNQSSSMYSFFEFVLFQLVAWFYEVHVLASILDSLSFFQVRCYVYELFISMLIHIRDSSTGLASTHDRITNLDHFKPPFYTFYLPFYNLKVVEFFVIC